MKMLPPDVVATAPLEKACANSLKQLQQVHFILNWLEQMVPSLQLKASYPHTFHHAFCSAHFWLTAAVA